MSSITSLSQIALTALEAAQTGLDTTGNNIANANSPGYSRETVQQAAQVPEGQGGVIQGTGVTVTGITRSFSQYAENRLWRATASSSMSTQLQSSLSQLNNLLASSGSGIGSTLSAFFQASQTLAGNPSGSAERQGFLAAAQNLSNAFNTVGGAIASQQKNVSQQIASTVSQVNSLTKSLAKLNVQIANYQGSAAGSQPNGLLDQRDQLVTKLNKLVGVSVIKQSNGSFSVFTANGQTLVSGAKAFTLGTQPNPLDPQLTDVVYMPSGALLSNQIQGGQLGGLFAARTTLGQTQNRLGQIALALADNYNQQQSLGLDAQGKLGSALFSVAPPQITADSANKGSANLSATVTNSSQVSGSSYQLSYQAGNWTVSTYPGGKPVSVTATGGTLSFDGLQVKVSGTPANGDRFLLQPTVNAATSMQTVLSSPTGIAAAAPYVSSAGSVTSGALVNQNTGNVTISSGQVVSSVAPGAVPIPSSDFGKTLTVQFTSSGVFQVSAGGSVITSAPYSPSSGSTIDVAYPSPAPSNKYWQVQLTGSSPHAGDAFVIQPSGPGDNRNALAFGQLAQTPTIANGSETFTQAYSNLTGTVGTAGQQAALSMQADQANLSQAQSLQQSISGVNLNQQAANLLKYQEAFQAAAKSISVANQLFQSILGL